MGYGATLYGRPILLTPLKSSVVLIVLSGLRLRAYARSPCLSWLGGSRLFGCIVIFHIVVCASLVIRATNSSELQRLSYDLSGNAVTTNVMVLVEIARHRPDYDYPLTAAYASENVLSELAINEYVHKDRATFGAVGLWALVPCDRELNTLTTVNGSRLLGYVTDKCS
jgi:hypothetical protein